MASIVICALYIYIFSVILTPMQSAIYFSLIAPLKFSGDYRPFFTIHDSEFREYTTRTSAPPSVILGVTNPFFAKTLQHWPHIIRIGDNNTGQIPCFLNFKGDLRVRSLVT